MSFYDRVNEAASIIVADGAIAFDAPSCEELSIIDAVVRSFSMEDGTLSCLPEMKVENIVEWNMENGFREIKYNEGGGIDFSEDPFEVGDYMPVGGIQNPLAAIQAIAQYEKGAIFILRDVGTYLSQKTFSDQLEGLKRTVKNLIDGLLKPGRAPRYLILIGDSLELQPFQGRISTMRLPLPSQEEIITELRDRILVRAIQSGSDLEHPNLDDEQFWNRLAIAAGALSMRDIVNVFNRSRAVGVVGENTVQDLQATKSQQLKDLGVDVAQPPDVPVGGLEELTEWLRDRASLFHNPDPRIPRTKGVLIFGHPGCGKSLCAKTAGQILGIPVLSAASDAWLDKYVGGSQEKLRKLLRLVEASAPCVLWIDEIEKALGRSGGESDGGVQSQVLGIFLTWMQECQKPVFMVATANDVDGLPPELKRRFGEVFCVKLPGVAARTQVLRIHLTKWGFATPEEQIEELAGHFAARTEGYSPAELARLVEETAIKAVSRTGPGVLTESLLQSELARLVPASRSDRDAFLAREARFGEFRPASREQFEALNR